MNIAIDLDDVTVAIMNGLIDYHNKRFDTNFTIHDHIFFDLHKIWKCTPEEAMKRAYDFFASDHMDRLLPMEGAVEGINALSYNHQLVFITSRPDSVKEKTLKWLKKYFPDKDIPVYFTNQYTPATHKKLTKSEVCKKVGATIIIEDSPAYVLDCANAGIRVLMYDRPWNRTVANNPLITRVNSWSEILKIMNH